MEDERGTRQRSKWTPLVLALPVILFVVVAGIHEWLYRTLPPEEAAEASEVLLAIQEWLIVAVGIGGFLYTSLSQRVPETNRAIILALTAMQLPRAVRYTWAPDWTPLALRLDLVIPLIVIGVMLFALANPKALRAVWAGTYVVVAASVLGSILLLLQ